MKTFAASLLTIALIGVSLPTPASAATFTYVCEPSTQPAPPDWFGGPWPASVRLVIDTTARSAEIYDQDNVVLASSAVSARLAGLNDHRQDMTVTENVITWGIVEMWGFSGYIDLKSGRLDLVWSNPGGYSPATLNRQFHGTCTLK